MLSFVHSRTYTQTNCSCSPSDGSEFSRHSDIDGENHSRCVSSLWGGQCCCCIACPGQESIFILYSCIFVKRICKITFLASRWPGCRILWSLRLLVRWISKGTWLAVSICYCVKGWLTPVPPICTSVHSHEDRWLTARQSPLWATVPVSAAANSFIKQCCHTSLVS